MTPSYTTRDPRVNGNGTSATPTVASTLQPTDYRQAYPGATVNLTPAVDALGSINFEGNVIPHTWYTDRRLQHESGKANLVAITMLSEICYWYRPQIVHDEMSGRLLSISKRFAADKLHWDHEQRAAKFGLSKRQVADAIVALKTAGIIDFEVRDRWVLPSGAVLYNQVFIEPIPQAIRSLCGYGNFPVTTDPDPENDDHEAQADAGENGKSGSSGDQGDGSVSDAPSQNQADLGSRTTPSVVTDHPPRSSGLPPLPTERTTPSVTTGHPPRQNGGGPPLQREPSTENTPKISTETSGNVERSTDQATTYKNQTPTLRSGTNAVPVDRQPGRSQRSPLHMPSQVETILRLTNDHASSRRFLQLWEICVDSDALADWDEAEQSLQRAVDRNTALKPGAYFQTVLIRLLERRQIFVPTAAERADKESIQGEIAASLAAGAATGAPPAAPPASAGSRSRTRTGTR